MPLLYDVISRTGAPQPLLVTSPSRAPIVVQGQLMDTLAPYLAWTQLIPQPPAQPAQPTQTQSNLPPGTVQPATKTSRTVPTVPRVSRPSMPNTVAPVLNNVATPAPAPAPSVPLVPLDITNRYLTPHQFLPNDWWLNPPPTYNRFQFPETTPVPAPVSEPVPVPPSTDPGFSETELAPYLWEWVKYGLRNMWNYFSDPNHINEYDGMEY